MMDSRYEFDKEQLSQLGGTGSLFRIVGYGWLAAYDGKPSG
jgi:hypothetical protein